MQKPNQGVIYSNQKSFIRFRKSEWTLKAVKNYLKNSYPDTKYKRAVDFDPDFEYWKFEAFEEFNSFTNKSW